MVKITEFIKLQHVVDAFRTPLHKLSDEDEDAVGVCIKFVGYEFQ